MPSFLARPLGRVSPRVIRGNISVSCNPSTSMTAPTAIVIRPSNVPLSANAEPIAPMIAPNAMKETIRPALKNRCGRNFCSAVSVGWFSAYFAATLITSPPISAIQVEKPAVRPTNNAIVPVLVLFEVDETNLSIPKTWKSTYNPRTTIMPMAKSFHTRSLCVKNGFRPLSYPTSYPAACTALSISLSETCSALTIVAELVLRLA